MKKQIDFKNTKLHSMRNCTVYDDSDFRKLLSGSLPESIETQLRHHFETCEDCAAQLSVVERMVDQEENSEILHRVFNEMNRIDSTK